MDTPQTKQELTFGAMLRTLRKGNHLTQAELASKIGIKGSSLANAEAGPYQAMGPKRVAALADALKLSDAMRAKLVELHAACPASPFQIAQRERWDKANAVKKDARSARQLMDENELLRAEVDVLRSNGSGGSTDALRLALAGLLDLQTYDEDPICRCQPITFYEGHELSAALCDLCRGMRALGFPEGWTTIDEVRSKIFPIIETETVKEEEAAQLAIKQSTADEELVGNSDESSELEADFG